MSLNRAFAALADPRRRRILRLLADRPMPASDVAEPFDVSRPAISKHLRVLLEADLVRVEEHGRLRVYHLNPSGLENVRRWMREADAFWDRTLEAFKSHVEEEE